MTTRYRRISITLYAPTKAAAAPVQTGPAAALTPAHLVLAVLVAVAFSVPTIIRAAVRALS